MDVAISVFLPLAIMTMMLSLGLSLTVRDFGWLFRRPKVLFCGIAGQFIVAPLIGFAIISAFGLSGPMAVGFMLLAACPGGGVSNLMAKLARGDVALSVCLTSISSLLCAFSIPFVLHLAMRHFIGDTPATIQMSDITVKASFVCIAPIILGMILHWRAPKIARRWAKALTRLSAVLLGIIIIGAVAGSWSLFVENMWTLGGSLVAMGGALIAFGYLGASMLGLGPLAARTIAIEAGIQNGAMGIAVAALLSQTTSGFSDFAIASALYGVLMYFLVIPMAIAFRLASRDQSRLQHP